MAMAFMAQLFILKTIHEFAIDKSMPLKNPTVGKTLPIEKYKGALPEHQ
jgi:hypothetical protein